MNTKKRFFTSHSKSSAAVVSIALHLILLLIAGTFVAVTVVTKNEKKFETRQVSRPRMPPKKLQVPVKVKKQRRKPKLRQRIVVKAKARNMPDIKMPEISGIKGGLGAIGNAGFGDVDSIGFSMPEINVFGIRSKGEKVFIALDSSAYIMDDKLGGKRAYKIIKDELAKIIEGLGPTTLFNLAVFEPGKAVALFPKMVPASRENTEKVEKWLEPLNASKVGTTGTYGVKTLGKVGTTIKKTDVMKARGNIEGSGLTHWYIPASEAMIEQADTVFILSGFWGHLHKVTGKTPEWKNRDRWNEYMKKAKEKHAEENKRRAAKGKDEQIFGDSHQLMRHYYPNQFAAYRPPAPPRYYYTGEDYAQAFQIVREDGAPDLPAKSGLTKRKKDKFSVNVVYFAPEKFQGTHGNFKELANRSDGDFRIIKGLKAIESSVK